MEGIEYTPNDTGRRYYSGNGKCETRSNPTQVSHNQSCLSYKSAPFSAFNTPATYTPLSPLSSDYYGSPLPYLPSLKAQCYPLSPPESVTDVSPPASASSPTSYAPSLSTPGTESDNGLLTLVGAPERFQITVRDLTGRIVTLNDIESSMKVSELKDKFEKKESIPKCEQKFIFQGKELINGKVYSCLLFHSSCGRIRRFYSQGMIRGYMSQHV
jgi:Ubiquitin family